MFHTENPARAVVRSCLVIFTERKHQTGSRLYQPLEPGQTFVCTKVSLVLRCRLKAYNRKRCCIAGVVPEASAFFINWHTAGGLLWATLRQQTANVFLSPAHIQSARSLNQSQARTHAHTHACFVLFLLLLWLFITTQRQASVWEKRLQAARLKTAEHKEKCRGILHHSADGETNLDDQSVGLLSGNKAFDYISSASLSSWGHAPTLKRKRPAEPGRSEVDLLFLWREE